MTQAAEPPWSLSLETTPDPAVRDAILAPLQAFNAAAGGPTDRWTLAVTVRGPSGTVVGGLWARTSWGMMFIELLALGPARGQGLGRRVMQLAEAEARRRGVVAIYLDTFTFQAPGFYRKLGFEEFGRVPGAPPGHGRVFFVKRLQP